MRIHRWPAAALVLSLIPACVDAPATDLPKAENAEFEALIERYLDQRFASAPTQAAEAGIPGFEGKLPDLSAEALSRKLDTERKLLDALRSMDPASLSREQRTDRLLLTGQLEWSIREAERRPPWKIQPDLYLPFQAFAGLVQKEGRPAEERARDLTARLRALPALLEQGKRNLENPPKRFTEAAIFQSGGFIGFLEAQVPQLSEKAGPAANDLVAANGSALTALRGFRTFLEKDLLPRSSGSWVLGREDYDFILKRRWFMAEDVDAILARGEKAFADTEALAQEVAGRLAPGKPWVEVYENLKDDHPAADRIKEAYQAQMERAQAFVRDHGIVTLPAGERVITVDTPEPMRRSSPFGTFDAAGLFDESLEGRLVLTPIEGWLSPEQRRERLRSHHAAWIPIIAVHEAYPGHHVHALKMKENARPLRKVISESIFTEGWGLYTEEMMYQEGFLQGDDVRLTQLRNRLWRAARVIIDASLHTGKMSIEDGVNFLAEKVRFERYAAELEVGMYPRRPTMVLGYLIGMQEIERIRDAYYAKFGKPARPSEFYDKLLRTGALPPALVRAELLGEDVPETQ